MSLLSHEYDNNTIALQYELLISSKDLLLGIDYLTT